MRRAHFSAFEKVDRAATAPGIAPDLHRDDDDDDDGGNRISCRMWTAARAQPLASIASRRYRPPRRASFVGKHSAED